MRFLPLVERELRASAKKPATYRSRFWATGLIALVAWSMYVSAEGSAARFGHRIFAALSSIAFTYCLLAGMRYAADSLSSEKREGTLGLLFLTDLRGHDVVLAKLVVSSLTAVYLLLAIVPVLAFPVLLGAVTGTEFVHIAFMLLAILFFSLSLGVLISAHGTSEKAVVFGTLVAALFLAFGFPMIWKVACLIFDRRVMDYLFLFPSPYYGFTRAFSTFSSAGTSEYWLCLWSLLLMGIASITAASIALPKVFQERPQSSLRKVIAARVDFRRLIPHRSKTRTGWQRRLLERNPFLWLVERDRVTTQSLFALGVIITIFGLWSGWAIQSRSNSFTAIAILGSIGAHWLVKFLLAGEALRQMNQDKRTGALELLLSTPLHAGSIIAGQLRSIRHRFFVPIVGLVILNLCVLAGIDQQVSSSGPEKGMVMRGILILPLDCLALAYVGMIRALKGFSFARTLLATFGRVMLPSCLLFAFLMPLLAGSSQETVEAFFFSWIVISAIYDLGLIIAARKTLRSGFRRLAAGEVPPRRKLRLRLKTAAGPLLDGSVARTFRPQAH